MIASGGLGAQQERPAVSFDRALTLYLTQDCGTGEEDPDFWLQRVMEVRERAVAALRRSSKK